MLVIFSSNILFAFSISVHLSIHQLIGLLYLQYSLFFDLIALLTLKLLFLLGLYNGIPEAARLMIVDQ